MQKETTDLICAPIYFKNMVDENEEFCSFPEKYVCQISTIRFRLQGSKREQSDLTKLALMQEKLKSASLDNLEKSYEVTIEKEAINFNKRELQCAALLLQGLSAKEIALELNLSFRTIELYLANLRRKLKCNKKSEMVRRILDSSMIDLILENF